MSSSSFNDPDLPALVSSAMELRDSGLEPPIEEICSERPDLVHAVREALEASLRIPVLRREQATSDPLSGRVLGRRYRLDARLGSGAMGVVYQGEDLELKRPVAVKVLRSALMDVSEAEYRFGREAEALAVAQHPSVVNVYDRGRTVDDDPYIVMELLKGSSMVVLLDEGRTRGINNQGESTAWVTEAMGIADVGESSYLRCVVRWAADLASALGAAHAAGVFHRDVKPSNMFVLDTGKAVLLDFGIAAQLSQETITREGTALGTPAYMAPEALDPKVSAGPALDVYGLCASLYHMLAMLPPFSGTPSQILTSVATREPVPLAKARAGLPKDLLAIVECGMSRRMQDRYSSAQDLEMDLRAFLAHRPVKARASTALGRAWRRMSRSSAVRAAALVGVMGLMALGWKSWSDHQDEARKEQHDELWGQLPPSLGITFYQNRPMTLAEGRVEVKGLLDRMVNTGHDQVASRIMRASFSLDHGNVAGAKADVRAIAGHLDTEYARSLTLIYDALEESAPGAQALNLESLAEPEGAMDHYLHGFHLARQLNRKGAVEYLADPRLAEYLPAREVLLQCDPRSGHFLYGTALELEALAGRRSATTAHLLGTARILLKDYQSALQPIHDGLELKPNSEPLRYNKGWAAWRLGNLEVAREEWLRCIELKPKYSKPYMAMVDMLLDEFLMDECRQLLDDSPLAEEESEVGTLAFLYAEIDAVEGYHLYTNGDLEAAQVKAQEALEGYGRATELGITKSQIRRTLAKAILVGTEEAIFSSTMELAIAQPMNQRRLLVALRHLPAEPSEQQSELLGQYILSLIEALKAVESTVFIGPGQEPTK